SVRRPPAPTRIKPRPIRRPKAACWTCSRRSNPNIRLVPCCGLRDKTQMAYATRNTNPGPGIRKVLRYLQKNQARFVHELCDYVSFPSVSAQPHHRKDLEACARWLAQRCRHIGLQTRVCPTPGNPII